MSNFAIRNIRRQIIMMPEVLILRNRDHCRVEMWNIKERLAPFWYLFWNMAPGAALVFGDRTVELNPEVLVLIPPLTLFSTRSTTSFTQFFIEFTAGAEFKEMRRHEIIFPAAKYVPMLTAVHNVSNSRRSMQLYHLLFDLLLLIPEENFRAECGQAIDSRIVKALDLMNVRPKNECTNRQLSRALNMSPSNFSHLFKENIGMSPQRYILQRQLEKAQLMLTDHELDINTIAMKTGFADRYHFSKAFKAFFGTSPAAMRKKLDAEKY